MGDGGGGGGGGGHANHPTTVCSVDENPHYYIKLLKLAPHPVTALKYWFYVNAPLITIQ